MPSPEPDLTRSQRTRLTDSGKYEEKSAGALVFHRGSGGPRYLLLKYPAGHWDFPKGNIEKGETPLETMHREVREETGLTDVSPVEGFEHLIEYYYSRDGLRIRKEVVFFLAESKVQKVTLSSEHKDYRWLSFDDAMNLVTYSNSKKLLRAAEQTFKTRSSSG